MDIFIWWWKSGKAVDSFPNHFFSKKKLFRNSLEGIVCRWSRLACWSIHIALQPGFIQIWQEFKVRHLNIGKCSFRNLKIFTTLQFLEIVTLKGKYFFPLLTQSVSNYIWIFKMYMFFFGSIIRTERKWNNGLVSTVPKVFLFFSYYFPHIYL